MQRRIMAITFMVSVLLFGTYMPAHAGFSFGTGTSSLLLSACNPDLTPSDPTRCSIDPTLFFKGGSAPDANEIIEATITVPSGTGLLVCRNKGGNLTYSPGLGGVTQVDVNNGSEVISSGNGQLTSYHRFTTHIDEFYGNVLAFREYWGLPIDQTLCRNHNFTEYMYYAPELFVSGTIYSNCENINDKTTCTVDALLEARCKVKDGTTPSSAEWTYQCPNITITNNP